MLGLCFQVFVWLFWSSSFLSSNFKYHCFLLLSLYNSHRYSWILSNGFSARVFSSASERHIISSLTHHKRFWNDSDVYRSFPQISWSQVWVKIQAIVFPSFKREYSDDLHIVQGDHPKVRMMSFTATFFHVTIFYFSHPVRR